jgi:predicted HAD superfamily Cof-like phosphohydrolase
MDNKFKEPEALTSVAKFHDTFGMPIVDTPCIPDEKRCQLRVSLLQEELNELKEALENNDLIETADALADLQYVLSGAILEFGLAESFKDIFDEVQRSNMSKTCKSMNVAKATQKHYLENKDTESYIHQKGDEYLVYRKEDQKVLKSVEYSPADINKFIKYK